MADVAWEMTNSVEADASVEFAWGYWTNVANWDDPPATFALEGPFAPGTRGVTHVPGQPPIPWFIRDVKPGEAATIEIPADGAAMAFEWRFAAAGTGRTRITQRVLLRGENAGAYIGFAKTFETNLPDGMKKLVATIEGAAVKQSATT
jgi:hypothetical protein